MIGIPDTRLVYPIEFAEKIRREDPANEVLKRSLESGLGLAFWFKSRLPKDIRFPGNSTQVRVIELYNWYRLIINEQVLNLPK